MHVLVTGSGGFIGSHLCEALRDAGHNVYGLARLNSRDTFGWLDEVDGIEKLRGDVTDCSQMRHFVSGMDRVYHLAALGSVPYSFSAPSQFVDVNVTGTLNVAMACADLGVELVHTSTSEVYGNAPTPQDEDTRLEALSPYAASKIGADFLVRSLCASRGLKAAILRPFNTYGPRQSARAVIPRIILQCLDADCRHLELGNVMPQRDLVYVTDTCEAFMSVQPSEACPTFVAATGMSYSVSDIAKLIMEATGRDLPIVTASDRTRPRTAEVHCLKGSADKLMFEEGWQPEWPLEAGLKETIEWFSARGDRLTPGVF